MNCCTLHELSKHFLSHLSVLQQAYELSGSNHNHNGSISNHSVCIMNRYLDEIKQQLKIMRHHVENAKTVLEQKEEINVQLKSLIEKTKHVLDNIPSRLPKIKSHHMLSVTSLQESVDNNKTEHGVNFSECQYLRFLTVQEFESIPKYIKGRLTYDKVNQIIELLDKAYKEKYKILSQKKATLSDLNRKRCEIFRSQESKDTKGIYFIVEKDVTEFTNLKLDISARNTLTILRHCGLIHEIRGGGIVRYGTV